MTTETIADVEILTDVLPGSLIVARTGGAPPYDETHPTFHPHADLPVNEEMAAAMAAGGWLGGAIEAERQENGDVVIVDGRQRDRAAVKALKKNPDLRMTVIVRPRGDSPLATTIRTIGLNKHRHRQGTPAEALTEAFEVQALQRDGMKPKGIATLMGWESTETVRTRLKLLEAAPELQAALTANTHTASDILRIVTSKATPEAQVRALAKVPAKSPDAPKKRRSGAPPKTGSANSGIRKPTQATLVLFLDELEEGSPLHTGIRVALGLLKVTPAVAKTLGISVESPVYKRLAGGVTKGRPSKEKAAKG